MSLDVSQVQGSSSFGQSSLLSSNASRLQMMQMELQRITKRLVFSLNQLLMLFGTTSST
jgi:hypothetical protein